MRKSSVIQQVLYLTFPQCVFVLHLQNPPVLDNVFLFLKAIEQISCYQFLNKASFWAKKEYKIFWPCLKSTNDWNCALRMESHS